MKVATTAALLLFTVACGGGGGEGNPDLPAEIEIGTAEELDGVGFAHVDDGQRVELVPGSQGGFHVWTTPRMTGAAGTVYLDREARRVSDDVLVLRAARAVFEVPPEAMNEWWNEETARPSFMCPSPIGIRVYDEEIVFRFELRSEDEELLAVDEIALTPTCPADVEDWCREVCGG
jgi:hypothetical protein